ncbi:MAG: YidC/Oxa1 family membrane protein insertase [Candidatus Magasanikbacteria bacterium]|nr:YidC/Oxa1 family membrane protein insertase [Candidatus Magasanikbacteria bacterium]
MLISIWNDLLYKPLFNFLIWVYNNWTNQNLGWAVVNVTILLRIALLPFTLVSERNRVRNEVLIKDVKAVQKNVHMDSITKKQEIRKMLKLRRVQPWAKAVVLGIQAVVLILIYQVFLRGITGDKIAKFLYPSVELPGDINTIFFGFELGMNHSFFWSALVGMLLFFEIYRKYKKLKLKVRKKDLAYFFLFPFSVFLILWFLPMVKALFVLTSLLFSVIVHQFTKVVFTPKKMEDS